jgi:hypothetical protein
MDTGGRLENRPEDFCPSGLPTYLAARRMYPPNRPTEHREASQFNVACAMPEWFPPRDGVRRINSTETY